MKGRLKDRSLESLLNDLHGRGATGVLTLEKGPIKKQICFLKGLVRFAASNRREDRLSEFLKRSETLPEAVIAQAEREVVSLGRKIGEVLIEKGAISPERLRSWVRAHILDIILPAFFWDDGEYRFQEGVPNIVGEVTADIPPLEFTLERARRQTPRVEIQRTLAERSLVPVPAIAPSMEINRVNLTAVEGFVLSRADGQTDIAGILSLSPMGEAETARALAALHAVGVLSYTRRAVPTPGQTYIPAAGGSSRRGPADVSEQTGEVAYFARMYALLSGADHYKTLGVDRRADADEIRRAYYALAKEIHPDRFLSPPFDTLHSKMEALFTQVGEAYTTLTDPEARGRYDTELLTSSGAPKDEAVDEKEVARQNFLRGRALVEMGKMTEAVTFLQNAVDLEPARAEYRRVLAALQAKNPRLRREAEQNFLKAIELDPARGDTYLQLGLLYRRTGEAARAVEMLGECLKWDPTNVDAQAALEEIHPTGGAGLFGRRKPGPSS